MTYPLVRDLADEGFPDGWPAGYPDSPQSYYGLLRHPVGDRELADACVIKAHGDDPAFGPDF